MPTFLVASFLESDYLHKVMAPEVLPNWILMVVGVVGTVIGVITLLYIFRQSKDTEKALHWAKESAIAAMKSADAGLLNAKAIINAERAWITASVEWISGLGRMIQGDNESSVTVRFTFENQGRTPAWLTSRVYGCLIRDTVPEEPDFNTIQPKEGLAVMVTKAQFIEDKTLTDYGDVSRAKFIIVYGAVKYRDIFDVTHSTVFGYRIFPSYKDKIEPFLDFPKYNTND